MASYQKWPVDFPALPALNLLYYIITLTIVTVLLNNKFIKLQTNKINLLQLSITSLLIFVWAFLFLSLIVLYGVGTSRIELHTGIPVTCITTVWGAVLIYGAAKLCVLAFLSERVFLVHSHSITAGKMSRFQSNWYKVSLLCIFVWLVVGIVDITGKIAYLDASSNCIIGIKPYASISLIIIDFLVNLFLTTAFTLPIYASPSPPLRRLAQKSILASLICFLSTTINMVIMTVLGGNESSYLNLFCCSLDIFINGLVIYAISNGEGSTTGSGWKGDSDLGLAGGGGAGLKGGITLGPVLSRGIRNSIPNGYPGILVETEEVIKRERDEGKRELGRTLLKGGREEEESSGESKNDEKV